MRFAAVLSLILTMPMLADAVEEVRRAEIAFAKAFADRDKDRFFSFVADDATFLAPNNTAAGKPRVVARWSRYFEGPRAPFSWGPDRVTVSADGTLALSSGPVFDAGGNHAGSFQSTWRKQADGSWKVLFDGSGPGAATFAADAVPEEEGFVTTPDGVKLHYRKAGRSPVVMIVPLGFILHERMKQFADLVTVISYDPRNRGRSDRKTGTTIEDDVRDLEAVRAHFKAETFIPAGYSYLGKMVMLYAAAHPERVHRVIQLAPAANAGQPLTNTDLGIPAEVLARWQRMQREGAMQSKPREFCEAQGEAIRYMLVGDAKNAPRVEIDCSLESEWPSNTEPHFETLLPTVAKRVLPADELKRIAVPVLTIHGTKDRNAPYGGGQAWAAELPDARLVTLDGAAHAIWIDDPVGTFGAIRAFLRGEWPLGSERVAR